MRIQRLSLLAGARQARGVAVAIDVLRASSHIVTLFDRGARAVVPAETLERAREFKRKNPDWILAGERRGLPPAGVSRWATLRSRPRRGPLPGAP
ncbi:MAG: 2-phosphosulfolactate phosphatase [Acidobacteriota bacterium]|nr:2-phosphosulfolactate phosphatase [Acidobacteriota bacterium]